MTVLGNKTVLRNGKTGIGSVRFISIFSFSSAGKMDKISPNSSFSSDMNPTSRFFLYALIIVCKYRFFKPVVDL